MSTIKTTTLSTQGGSTVPVDTVVNGTAKAWVNFNGTGTVAIRRAFNVSSITDESAGRYQINFTTDMIDANYATALACMDYSYGSVISIRTDTAYYTTSSCKILTFANNVNAYFDPEIVCASIFS